MSADPKTSESNASTAALKEWPLWEVFVRSKQGLEHKHCGSLHASDSQHALQMARDVYTRRQEGAVLVVCGLAILVGGLVLSQYKLL